MPQTEIGAVPEQLWRIASSFRGLKCHISQPRKPLAPCLRLSDVNLRTCEAGSRSPPAVEMLCQAHLAARAGGPGPIVAENAPGNRCRRSPAQYQQRASLACPFRPIPVLFARAGSVSTAATGLKSGVILMRGTASVLHAQRAAARERGAGSTGEGRADSGAREGRARTHQQGAHDAPERDPSCCPHDRPLRRPCPVAQTPAPPGT